jgi:hypothetical protein
MLPGRSGVEIEKRQEVDLVCRPVLGSEVAALDKTEAEQASDRQRWSRLSDPGQTRLFLLLPHPVVELFRFLGRARGACSLVTWALWIQATTVPSRLANSHDGSWATSNDDAGLSNEDPSISGCGRLQICLGIGNLVCRRYFSDC